MVQGATEKYSNFIDRLWDAVMNHPDLGDENKQQKFRILAFDKANKTTKQILASLTKGAGVEEMLSRVERAGAQNQNETVAAAVQSAVREVIQPFAAVIQRKRPQRSDQPFCGSCFRCGETGHAKRNCRNAVWCDKCQKKTHSTKACTGNWKPRVERGLVQNQMNPQSETKVFCNSTKLQRGAAWESMWRPQ